MTIPNQSLTSEYLVLTIPLVDHITPAQLGKLLQALEWHYRANLWIDRLEAGVGPGESFGIFQPRRLEALWIDRLEIGSPNLLRVRGLRNEILKVAAAVSTVLGTPLTLSQSFEAYAQGRKALAETELIRLDVAERAEKIARRKEMPTADVETFKREASEMMGELQKSSDIIAPDTAPALELPVTDRSASPPQAR